MCLPVRLACCKSEPAEAPSPIAWRPNRPTRLILANRRAPSAGASPRRRSDLLDGRGRRREGQLLLEGFGQAAQPFLGRAGTRLGGLQATFGFFHPVLGGAGAFLGRLSPGLGFGHAALRFIHAVLRDQIVPRAGNSGGVTWHYCRPPIEELEYEMDVRSVAMERVLELS